jgi:hypothetical protein
VPVAWDLSDLEDQCNRLLADPELMQTIRENAVREWLAFLDRGFVELWNDLCGRPVRRDPRPNSALVTTADVASAC